MRQPRDQHWADLLEAVEMEAKTLGGYGEVVLRVRFHDGQPREVAVQERLPKYRLGRSDAPLTGA